MPELFGIKTIDYWQTIGIVILAKIIFGFGSHHHGNGKRRSGKWDKENCGDWRNTEDWNVGGSWQKWKYYDEYWREEGKDFFEKYLERKENEKRNTENPEKSVD